MKTAALSSWTDTQTGLHLPIVSGATQAAVVAGLAVDAAGFAPAGGDLAMGRPNRLFQVLEVGQVGGGGVCGGALQEGRWKIQPLNHTAAAFLQA